MWDLLSDSGFTGGIVTLLIAIPAGVVAVMLLVLSTHDAACAGCVSGYGVAAFLLGTAALVAMPIGAGLLITSFARWKRGRRY